jgi:hypothetical protein
MTWVIRHGKFIESNNKKYEISLPIDLILKVEINKKIHETSTWPNINEIKNNYKAQFPKQLNIK